MATIMLSAVGASVGNAIGGTVLGMSAATVGRAVGAVIGRAIDSRVMGRGSAPVEMGRIERFRLMTAGEGQPVATGWGRLRLGGQVIWASPFHEEVHRSGGGGGGGGGKGGMVSSPRAPDPEVTQFSYSVSLALALCEGEILHLGRIWADGQEIAPASLNLRIHRGDADQLPDPLIEAFEGAGQVPAWRGLAYVVIDSLQLGPWGNRVPQFAFEVVRPAQQAHRGMADTVRAVAMIPGTGEYSLSTTPVSYVWGPGAGRSANMNSASGLSDLQTSIAQLRGELPNVRSVSMVVSWFGDDLRCDRCTIRPGVEQADFEGTPQPWHVAGLDRADAPRIARRDGRPIYGGTPTDAGVIEGVRALRAAGLSVMYYPFILMDQQPGNGRTDPWTGAADQPVMPWRGRITLSVAPGRAGSPDRGADADAQVAAFMGHASVADFSTAGGAVHFGGQAQDWGFRRFILHQAFLCRLAGGVDAFCIGSEMRGLTTIRGAGDSFPAVAALRQLAADVRAVLGPECRISYAADWSEYWGCVTPEGHRHFHLDPLWADGNIDFIGIDNYMPLSDWRDGHAHADAAHGSIHDLACLKAGIGGGEGFDWYYDSLDAQEHQRRTPITDGDHGEPWVWAWKDLRSWWENVHHDRTDAGRAVGPSPWLPRSKPVWFTEIGCAALDRATNQPNVFLDPHSSESMLPKYSSGRRDDFIQMQYLRAMQEYWDDPAANPWSDVYGGRMLDTGRSHVWAWDARPFPHFPGTPELWGDGPNYARGHWINGRSSNQPLASVVRDICLQAGLPAEVLDTEGLHGVVRGHAPGDALSARAVLQPLMLVAGFEVIERGGMLRFRMRDGRPVTAVRSEDMVVHDEFDGTLELSRAAEAELTGRVQLGFVEAEADFVTRFEEASLPDGGSRAVSRTELTLMLTPAEARETAERWLSESRIARDVARLSLPPSRGDLGVGDVLDLGAAGFYRIDRTEGVGALMCEAQRVEPGIYRQGRGGQDDPVRAARVPQQVPLWSVFMDLPLIRGDEDPGAPHLAVSCLPWQGAVGLWDAGQNAGYRLNRMIEAPAAMGTTLGGLRRARPGCWDRGEGLRVRMLRGTLHSASAEQVLAGANLVAIGDGRPDGWELFQFTTAEPVAPGEWLLSGRLRGQAGTETEMRDIWPEGSTLVVMDGTPAQIDLPPALRAAVRHYRIGVAARGLSDGFVEHRELAFAGLGLRPLAPVHLRGRIRAGGAALSWIRRTRVEGDGWDAPEVPLAEQREAYRLRVRVGGQLVREQLLDAPGWLYPADLMVADGADGGFAIEVAQLSDRFGAGALARLDVVI